MHGLFTVFDYPPARRIFSKAHVVTLRLENAIKRVNDIAPAILGKILERVVPLVQSLVCVTGILLWIMSSCFISKMFYGSSWIFIVAWIAHNTSCTPFHVFSSMAFNRRRMLHFHLRKSRLSRSAWKCQPKTFGQQRMRPFSFFVKQRSLARQPKFLLSV